MAHNLDLDGNIVSEEIGMNKPQPPKPSKEVLWAAHDAEREIWNLSTYAGTSPDDREKIIAEFFAGFESGRLREIIEHAAKSYRDAASTRINDKDGAFWQNSFADDLERMLKESRGEE